jgi:hypothetical protein
MFLDCGVKNKKYYLNLFLNKKYIKKHQRL